MSDSSNWEILKNHEQYKISNVYPYEIRKIKNDMIVRPFLNNGYYVIHLTNNKIFQLGRIIADHFIPNPDNLPVIDYIDCNKKNFHIDNLRWCDHGQNHQKRLKYVDTIDLKKATNIWCYSDWTFDNLYFLDDQLYKWNGKKYLVITGKADKYNNICFNTTDVNGKVHKLYSDRIKQFYDI